MITVGSSRLSKRLGNRRKSCSVEIVRQRHALKVGGPLISRNIA